MTSDIEVAAAMIEAGYLVVPSCPYCGERHVHGLFDPRHPEAVRVAHCAGRHAEYRLLLTVAA